MGKNIHKKTLHKTQSKILERPVSSIESENSNLVNFVPTKAHQTFF
jgi:hypothetical protein